MYSVHNKQKSVVAERLKSKIFKTLKTIIYKYMTSISKNVYIDKSDDIVSEYNNTYHKTIKIKSVDVKDNTYIDSMELHPNKDKLYYDKLVANLYSIDTDEFVLKTKYDYEKNRVRK